MRPIPGRDINNPGLTAFVPPVVGMHPDVGQHPHTYYVYFKVQHALEEALGSSGRSVPLRVRETIWRGP
jgi:hypothetical protein